MRLQPRRVLPQLLRILQTGKMRIHFRQLCALLRYGGGQLCQSAFKLMLCYAIGGQPVQDILPLGKQGDCFL